MAGLELAALGLSESGELANTVSSPVNKHCYFVDVLTFYGNDLMYTMDKAVLLLWIRPSSYEALWIRPSSSYPKAREAHEIDEKS